MPAKERKRAVTCKRGGDEEECLESECLPKKMPELLDKEENMDPILDSGDVTNETTKCIPCEPAAKIKKRDEEDPDEEESSLVVVEMKWKTPSEKERSRQGRKRQLEEYHKREAVLARRERYRKRCRGMEDCDGDAVDRNPLPQHPPESVDTSPRKHVQWKRDDSLVVVHEMSVAVEEINDECSDRSEKSSDSESGSSSPNQCTVQLPN